MAAPSKATLIETANWLRRESDRLRRANLAAFREQVYDVRAHLLAVRMGQEDVLALLPDALLAPLPSCRLQPLADHVVVRPAAAKDVTAGGLIIPETAKEVPMRGTILAVGPGRIEHGQTVLMAALVGNEVLFGRYAGVEVTLDGEDVRIMREEDLLGILAPDAA